MKVEFSNSDLTPSNLSDKWKEFYDMMQEDVTAFYVEQSKYNAPLIEGTDQLADSVGMTKFNGKSSVIFADDPAAYVLHEEMGKQYDHDPKEQQSKSGGIGPKYIERAFYNTPTIIKEHYVKSMNNFFEGKPYKKLAKGDADNYVKDNVGV